MLRNLKYSSKLFFILLFTYLLGACTADQSFVSHLTHKQSWPNNINYSANHIEFTHNSAFSSLKNKWKNQKNINIAHFGDSHIQTGWQVGPLRDMFQALRGDAGRGMIFPYAIAKTYSQEDYRSYFIGKWKTSNSMHQPPKIPLGVSGFVATTQDKKAQVDFKFRNNLASAELAVNVIFKAYGSYHLTVSNGTSKDSKIVKASSASQNVKFTLPYADQNLSLSIEALQEGTTFELHGLSLYKNQSGVVYHNLGVGGATFSALLEQRLFAEQFSMLKADLVILDWGTNDLIYKNAIDPTLEHTIRQTIRKIKALNPNTAILLTSVQEANYKGKAITSTERYAQLLRRIAKAENVLFYDWYAISGKQNSVAYWRAMGFASKDGIHLNQKGYQIRAKLLGEALLNALNK